MKKLAAFCLILIIALSAASAIAAPVYEDEVKPNAVMLLDATTGQVLYEKNADEHIRPASTTKILTLLVAIENSDMDDEVTIGPEGDWTGSGYSLLGTKNGERIIMKDLLHGLMLKSGNDAAAAVAVHIGGSEEKFIDMMNDKAEEIGMTSSRFVNPHGTDKDKHYVTARDMSRLALYVVQNEEFMDIVGKESYLMPATNRNSARTVRNTNHLLRTDEDAIDGAYYEFATGIKTGSTPKAFRCLVSSAKKDGTELICLIFGDETKDGYRRWPTAKSLFEFGFENYQTIDVQAIIDGGEPPAIAVQNAANEDDILALNVRNTGEARVTIEKQIAQGIAETGGLESVIELYSGDKLAAPIREGDVVGLITYRSRLTSEIICRGELSATRNVDVIGEVTIEVTEETPRPQQTEATEEPTPQPTPVPPGPVIGLGWLWIVLGVVLIAVITLLVISLVRSARK